METIRTDKEICPQVILDMKLDGMTSCEICKYSRKALGLMFGNQIAVECNEGYNLETQYEYEKQQRNLK